MIINVIAVAGWITGRNLVGNQSQHTARRKVARKNQKLVLMCRKTAHMTKTGISSLSAVNTIGKQGVLWMSVIPSLLYRQIQIRLVANIKLKVELVI